MFYKVDSTRLTLREYVWTSPAIWLPIFVLLKLLRVRLPVQAAIPDCLRGYLVDPAVIPEDVRAKTLPLEESMQSCGFVEPIYQWIVDPFHPIPTCVVTFRHEAGFAMGRIVFRRQGRRRDVIRTAIVTGFDQDSWLVTMAGRREMLAPRTVEVRRMPGASVPDLWRSHQREVLRDASNQAPVRVQSRHELLDLCEHYEATHRDFHIERGLYVPCDEAEHQAIEAVLSTEGSDDDRRFSAVYRDMNCLANRKAGWTSTILTFLVSIALFLAVGLTRTAWQPLAVLVGVLLFHELGHLGAMAAFRYRNLRMLFIPFLGAIITGRNYCIPGWKKAVILLAGPLPGLLLGAALGIIASVHDWPGLSFLSLVLIALNLFNLLPLTPLDGGQLMEVLLFARHPTLNVVFRVFAVAALMAIGLWVAPALVIFGAVILMGVSTEYRVGKSVRRLQTREIEFRCPDPSVIPLEPARLIYDDLRQTLPVQPNARTMARLALRCFELLNATPPRWSVTLALLGLYVSSVGISLVVLFNVILER